MEEIFSTWRNWNRVSKFRTAGHSIPPRTGSLLFRSEAALVVRLVSRWTGSTSAMKLSVRLPRTCLLAPYRNLHCSSPRSISRPSSLLRVRSTSPQNQAPTVCMAMPSTIFAIRNSTLPCLEIPRTRFSETSSAAALAARLSRTSCSFS